MNMKDLSERDICCKFISPAVKAAGWDEITQIREEVSFTKGRILVRGKLVTRGKSKRADYILYHKPNIPTAIIEAKDNDHSVGDGMQQALDCAGSLNIPFVFSSNGDGFVFHDRTGTSEEMETNLALDTFPSPAEAGFRAPPTVRLTLMPQSKPSADPWFRSAALILKSSFLIVGQFDVAAALRRQLARQTRRYNLRLTHRPFLSIPRHFVCVSYIKVTMRLCTLIILTPTLLGIYIPWGHSVDRPSGGRPCPRLSVALQSQAGFQSHTSKARSVSSGA